MKPEKVINKRKKKEKKVIMKKNLRRGRFEKASRNMLRVTGEEHTRRRRGIEARRRSERAPQNIEEEQRRNTKRM